MPRQNELRAPGVADWGPFTAQLVPKWWRRASGRSIPVVGGQPIWVRLIVLADEERTPSLRERDAKIRKDVERYIGEAGNIGFIPESRTGVNSLPEPVGLTRIAEPEVWPDFIPLNFPWIMLSTASFEYFIGTCAIFFPRDFGNS